MIDKNIAFSDVQIAVVGMVNGKTHEVILTHEKLELVKAFVSTLFDIGETIKMGGELPLEIKKAIECERG